VAEAKKVEEWVTRKTAEAKARTNAREAAGAAKAAAARAAAAEAKKAEDARQEAEAEAARRVLVAAEGPADDPERGPGCYVTGLRAQLIQAEAASTTGG